MVLNGRHLLLPVAVGLSLCGLTAYLAYLFVKRDENEDYDPKTSHNSTLEIKVSKEVVPALIGRAGNNIRAIQDRSGCRINFKDECPDADFRVCVLRGESDSIHMAELLILQFLSNLALIKTEDIRVPQTACGRIIGRCGENVQKIMRASNTKINVDGDGNPNVPTRKITIRGTPDQILVAKSLIEAKVTEDEELRRNLSQRQPRGKPPSNKLLDPNNHSDPISIPKPFQREKLAESGQIDGQIEVYVSAVDDPSKFWVQIVGPKATELDQLVEQMTEYYGNEENRILHKLDGVCVGAIVAAVFEYDDKWYRAEVSEIIQDEKNPNNKKLNLCYVDYGDNGTVNARDVYELRTDFLRLRFQAIECFLAKIEPPAGEWTDDAVDYFEGLTQVAQWKKLWSKIVCYRERDASNSNGRARREGSPIPGVHLYDNNKNGDINIGEELIKSGHAKPERKVVSSPPSLSSARSDRTASEGRASPIDSPSSSSKHLSHPSERFLIDHLDDSNSNISVTSDSSGTSGPTDQTVYKSYPGMPSTSSSSKQDFFTPIKTTDSSSSSLTEDTKFETPINGNTPAKSAVENGNFHSDGDHLANTTPSKSVLNNKAETQTLLESERTGAGDFLPSTSASAQQPDSVVG